MVSGVRIGDYLSGVCAYIRSEQSLTPGAKKASQIRLSSALARSLATDLELANPGFVGRLVTHERQVAGALRTAKADVSESHELDGLRLAVELKPINLAVGRAIWNRFGDIRTFAVNIHLKFPFAVVGGVLVIPTADAGKSTVHLIRRAIERFERAGGRRSEADAAHLLEGIAVVAFDPNTGEVDPDLPEPGSRLRWSAFVDDLSTAYRARFEPD
ncbi:MAG: hypothetical protein EA355_11685 [Rhodobacteraceae bacterium]|nr:MAG: hypothetical protein EA355_11685 [Paracoccaceae bacterium]